MPGYCTHWGLLEGCRAPPKVLQGRTWQPTLSHNPSQGAMASEGSRGQTQAWPGHTKTFWTIPVVFLALKLAVVRQWRLPPPSAITARWRSLWGHYLKEPSRQQYHSIPSCQLYHSIPLPQAPREAPYDISFCPHPLILFPSRFIGAGDCDEDELQFWEG